jgi:purine-binding chemotaxis protein CheW
MSVTKITQVRPYLTFKLGDEVFAQDVGQVREVLEVPAITKVPHAPDFMCGVINLRGNVVPVVDLRLMLGMSKSQPTIDTCIVVTEVMSEGETMVLGTLVDAVQEVFELEPEQIEPVPRLGMKLRTEFIQGMGKHNEHFLIILDIDKIFSPDELELFQETAEFSPIVEPAEAAVAVQG